MAQGLLRWRSERFMRVGAMRIYGLVALVCAATAANAAQQRAYGPQLQGFEYPYPVRGFNFKSESQQFAMAYMDVEPEHANGRTVALVQDAAVCGASWQMTIARWRAAGVRVIVIDQIGTCKSSKPVNYQYRLQQLAANTHGLLATLSVGRISLVGHSMAGALAMRHAMMYPEELERLVLVDPLGLEDWKAEGAPYHTIDERYAANMRLNAERIEQFELDMYYGGHWKPEYDRWVDMLAGQYAGTGRERFAWNQALMSDMMYTQPVVYELERIRAPTLIIMGGHDRAVPFTEPPPGEIAARLGNNAELARRAAKRIANAKLIEFADLGHVPQIEAPERFNDALVQWLTQPQNPAATAGPASPAAPAGRKPAPTLQSPPAQSPQPQPLPQSSQPQPLPPQSP
jgi:pimeloyl-ACP methyl ester carboxylesterase